MISRLLNLILLTLLIAGCSRGKVSYYERGDLHTRTFLDHVSERDGLRGNYYEVKRNDKKQITHARHYSSQRSIIEKSSYTYTRRGQLLRHQYTEFFKDGPPRITREWAYEKGQVIKREEQWFTRSHRLERKLTVHYDANQMPYLEETWGLGEKIESSTEYNYDYRKRLDKSRRNFFLPDGQLRDYWLTIYNDDVQIINEDHYLPDNSLVAFYRYAYHPVKGYREHVEILEESRQIFISQKFDEYGLILLEEEKDRNLDLIKRTVFEYDDKHRPKMIHQYNGSGKLLKSSKYKKPRYLEKFRTPGL